MSDPAIILHHYPRSPFAEKVRLAFGLKRLSWRSVVQPRLAPKPALTPLTGGYRRIPVMQIGADVYCDTRRILAELDRRFLHAGRARFTAGRFDGCGARGSPARRHRGAFPAGGMAVPSPTSGRSWTRCCAREE